MGRDNTHLNVRTKSNKKKKKKKIHHESCRTNCLSDPSSVQRIKIVDSSELMAARIFIYLFL